MKVREITAMRDAPPDVASLHDSHHRRNHITHSRNSRASRRWIRVGGLIAWLLIGTGLRLIAAAEPEFTREQIEFFEKQVRPVLAAQCWSCHGEKKAESGLRLDSREALLKGGDRGIAVKPREADSSAMIHAIRRDGELQMPPNGRLSAEQIAAIEKWVNLGMPWPREASGSALSQAWKTHWAFQPVQQTSVPHTTDDDSSKSPIDRFVLERLAATKEIRSLTPQADRRTLIRRATFDLLGLPPTPEEVAEFEADPSPDAFERLVDRLLASPKYGERWGRHWLDVARYSDTKGYVFFEEKSYPWAYTYRDYVIRSLNEDKPYDQFVLEQLAADLVTQDHETSNHRDKPIESPTNVPSQASSSLRLNPPKSSSPSEQLPALGFLTVGSHFMGNVHDIVDDRIDVVTRGLLGLTVTCARCHDHKYDPVPTADYYSLYGIFRSTTEPLVLHLFSEPKDTPEYRRFTAELSLRQQQLDDFVKRKHSTLVEGARTRVGEYLLAAKAANEKPAIDDFMLIADPGDLNPAMIVRWQAYLNKVEGRTTATQDQTIHRANTHPVWGPWFELAALPEERFKDDVATVCQRIAASTNPTYNPLVVKSVCGSTHPVSLADVAARYGSLMKSVHERWQNELLQAVILKRPSPERMTDPVEEELRIELYGETAPANIPLIFGWGFLSLLPDRASQGEYQKVLKHVEQWLIHGPGAPPRAMVLLDGEPFDPRVFIRGNPNRLGDAVPRQFLTALDRDERKPFRNGSGRLELARAVIDPRNPLTSRVMVNRVWQHLIGAGLVRTPGDFGMRSDPPTHPALLDWLAAEFVADSQSPVRRPSDAWSIKRLQRLVLSSRVYQQASLPANSLESDPDNRWLSHANRKRLDFEATRDALLFVTGRLDDRIGGPSLAMLDGGFHSRRTVYAFLDRLDPPGLLSVFDFPSPAATSASRDTTTVSPQALFLMNGPLTATVAELVLQRPEISRDSSPVNRITLLTRLLFGREPKPEELALEAEFLGTKPDPNSWRQFVHALLLTNEFVFVD